MTRRATPQPGVDRMVSTSWSWRRWSSPAARQGRALARGLERRLPLQHHHVRDQNSSRRRAYCSLALKHGIYRDRTDGHRGRSEISSYSSLRQSMRAACDLRSRWGRSRTNDGALRGRVAREILMDKGDRDTALANGGRDAGLDKIWVAACRSAVGVSEPCLPFGRAMDVQVPPRTSKAIA